MSATPSIVTTIDGFFVPEELLARKFSGRSAICCRLLAHVIGYAERVEPAERGRVREGRRLADVSVDSDGAGGVDQHLPVSCGPVVIHAGRSGILVSGTQKGGHLCSCSSD